MTSLADMIATKTGAVFDLFHTLTTVAGSWGRGERPLTSEMLGVDRAAWREQLLQHSRGRLVGEVSDPVEIIRQVARAIDPTIPDDVIAATAANRIKRFETTITQIPDETITILQTLRGSGKALGLLSNADVMEMAAWDRSPLAGCFDAAVFSCEVGLVKPEVAIYELCLERLGVEASEAVFVGDGGSGELQGARAAGMTTVMMTGVIQQMWPEKIAPQRQHADFVIEDLSELVSP
jgi:putative hydrolase of the HAD superfamily